MSINVKQSTFLLIFGSIFVMTNAISIADIQNRLIAERFKRDDGDETTVAQETEAPKSDDATKKPEESDKDPPEVPPVDDTSAITVPPEDPLPGKEITTSGEDQESGASVKDQGVTVMGEPLVTTEQVDIRKDIEDLGVDGVKLGVHIITKIGNGVKHVSDSVNNTVRGLGGSLVGTVQNSVKGVVGTAVNTTQVLAQAIGFGGFISRIRKLKRKST